MTYEKILLIILAGICLLGIYMFSQETLDLSKLSDFDLKQMQRAGEDIKKCYEELKKQSKSFHSLSLNEKEILQKGIHYPEKDVFDPSTSSQYYYHSHRENEHGHFHLFLQTKGLPSKYKKDSEKGHIHLIAISIDEEGMPKALFTTNQWVTGEKWHTAEEIIEILPSFAIHHDKPSALINKWLSAMVILFRPQIEKLIKEKDVALLNQNRPLKQLLEDRNIEVITYKKIDLSKQLKAVQEVLEDRK